MNVSSDMCIDSSCAMLHHTFHSKHHSTNAHSLICTIVLFISGAVQSSSIMALWVSWWCYYFTQTKRPV